MRRGKYGITKRIISMLLSMVLVLAMVPITGVKAASAVTEGIVKVEADPYTLHAWNTAFDPINLTTEHAGGIWTDKSVLTKDQIAQALPGVNGLTVGDNNFLVALSALAANSVIVGHGQSATDTVFVLDISGSMSSVSLGAMVEATNDSIHTLLNAHPDARVGVILYSTNASVLLPLGRYTPVVKTTNAGESTEYIELTSSYIRTARIEERQQTGGGWPGGNRYETVIKEILKDADGEDFDNSVSLRGGTYIQGGLHAANQMFQNATVKTGITPVLVLMSDGAPTYVTGSYTNATGNNRTGDGNSSSDGEAFLSQLTGAYVKAKMAEKYGSAAYVYTLGLGVSDGGSSVSVAEAMLDTSKTRAGLDALWQQYLALATAADKTMSVDLAGSYSDASVTYNSTITEDNYKFVDKYFPATDASQLSTAFRNIVNEISLKGGYNVTRLNSDGTNASGFISFVDEIGTGMEVKAVKGILIGNTLFTGAKMAQALIEGAYGTATEPTALGNNMVWAIKQRMGITDTAVVHDLIQQAYNAGQLYYNAETGVFNNYICWFSDANGDYVGFWDYGDPNCPIPAGAVYANASYGMIGTTTDAQTAHASDMMYVNINISKKITTVNGTAVIAENTPEMVTFSIPASLIPTVTYQIDVEAESSEEINENTAATITYIPAEPIRLLYEVGIHDALTPENIESFIREGYQAKDASGNYYLYSNAWYWEPSDGTAADFSNPPTKDNAVGKDVLYDIAKNHITYAYFEPGEQNEHYHYVEDTVLYTKNGDTYTPVTGVLDTTGNTQYYYRHRTFVSKAAVSATNTQAEAKVDIHYGAIDKKVLADSSNYAQNASGQWYIKAGTMRYSIHSHDKDKTENTTGSFFARLHQLVNIKNTDAAVHHAELVYHGNNGRITYAPAQGFKLAKAMAAGATADGSFTFEIAVTGDSDGKLRVDGVEQNIVSGKVTVSLLAGQSVLVTGIDVGAVYTVTELDREGYKLGGIVSESATASIRGATIQDTIAENRTPVITFTNDNRYYGSLLVSKSVAYDKNVDGTADTTAFTIDIALPGMEGKQIFANGIPVTLNANGGYTISLKNGQSVLFTGIYEGTAYTVTERTQLPDGYSVVAGSFNGTVLREQTAVAAVENAYSPDDVTIGSQIGVKINKDLEIVLGYNGYLMNGYTFQFQLERYDAAAGKWVEQPQNASIRISNPATADSDYYGEGNKGSSTLDISGITFDAAGTHLFRISEQIPEDLKAGWTYDRTQHDFSVTVTDENLDGELEISAVAAVQHAEVTGTAGNWVVTADFQNHYVVNSTKLTIAANKTLINTVTGEDILSEGQFEFALYQTDDTFSIAGVVPTLAKNDAVGGVVFTTDVYPFSDTATYYYYVMKETSTSGNGITVDPTVWQIRVKVEPNGTNAAVSEIAWRQEGQTQWTNTAAPQDNAFQSITFNNTYKAENAILELFGNKVLTNLTPGVAEADRDMTASIKADDYRFDLHPVGNQSMTVQKADGTVESGVAKLLSQVQAGGRIDLLGGYKLVYTEAGTYEYKVLEYQSNVPGVTMDETEYTVKVQVVDNGEGQLVATATYWIGSQQVEKITFRNTYLAKPVTGITLSGIKALSVDTNKYTRALKAGEFHFTLTRPDGTTETVSNDANGGITFSALSFDRAGTYTYTITEYRAGTTYNGVAYDPNPKTVTIVVEDDGAGHLVAKVDGTKITAYDFGTFTNTYTATAATVQITGFKELAGRELKENDFSFTLSDASGVLETKGNAADGTIAFEKLTFDKVGTYTYTVEELKLDDEGNPIQPNADGEYVYKGVTYTKLSYTVTVTVTDHGLGQLVAEVKTVDNNGVEDPVEFLNTYKAESVTVDIAGNTAVDGKTLTDGTSATDKTLADFEFEFQLLDADKNVLQTVTDNDAGFDFQDIEYTEAGTYTYYIAEVDGGVAGVTYDKTVYKVTVVIEDDLVGSLYVKELTYEKAEDENDTTYEDADKITFANTYAAKETSVTFAGVKKLEGGRKLKGEDFSFILSDASGEIETVKNDKDGNFSFAKITYYEEGTWVYTLEEKNDGVDNIEYDGTKYTLTVTVVDENAQLKATVKIEKGQDEVDSYGFTNIYTPEDVKVYVDVQKILDNKTTESIGLDGFQFQLDLDGVSATQTSDAEGKTRFELTFTPADIGKTFTYTLTEVKGTKVGMTYDETVYTITVAISQNDDGELVPTVTGLGTAALTFTNIYEIKTDNENPKTGADMNGWMLALAFSAVCGLAVLVMGKKKFAE